MSPRKTTPAPQATMDEDPVWSEVSYYEPQLGRRLEDGDFLVQIVDITDETASTGTPGVGVRFENDEGFFERTIWYHRDFLWKIAPLIDSALGKENRPTRDDVDPSDNYRIRREYLDRLVGKWVGIVIRPEYNEQRGRTYQELQGVVSRERIEEALGERKDVRAGGPPPKQDSDEDIPFACEPFRFEWEHGYHENR